MKISCNTLSAATLAMIGTVLLSSAQAVAAEPGASPKSATEVFGTKIYTFAIPAQALGSALDLFARQSGLKITYSPADVAGLKTTGISGNFSALEALTVLLARTRLLARQDGNAVVIAPRRASTAIARATAGPVLAKAWQSYRDALDEARVALENTPRFQENPAARAKTYHTLMEVQAMAYNFIVAPRLDQPRIQNATSWLLNTYTLGQNSPDTIYGLLTLDGRQTYRIMVRPGKVRLNVFEVYSHVLGVPGNKLTGNFDVADFKPNADGWVEIIASAQRQERNWIPLDPNSTDNWIQIRRLMADWNDDTGEMKVELVSKPEPGFYDYDEFDEAAIAKRVENAGHFVKHVIENWVVGIYDMYLAGSGGHPNRMSLLAGTTTSQYGSPSSQYSLGVFELQRDEALVVKFASPADAAYWSLALGDEWSRSLDFMNRQSSINLADADIMKDGTVWAVVSPQDPGVWNWLDTTDHLNGIMLLRNYRSNTPTVPQIWKVKLADIWKLLPLTVRRATPAERQQLIERRKAGFQKAFNGAF